MNKILTTFGVLAVIVFILGILIRQFQWFLEFPNLSIFCFSLGVFL